MPFFAAFIYFCNLSDILYHIPSFFASAFLNSCKKLFLLFLQTGSALRNGAPIVISIFACDYFVLLDYEAFKLPPLVVQLNDVVYPPAHKADIKRL